MTSHNSGKECKNCFWYGNCDGTTLCGYYYDVNGEEYSDGQIADMVERGRREYEQDWRIYVGEFD